MKLVIIQSHLPHQRHQMQLKSLMQAQEKGHVFTILRQGILVVCFYIN